LQAVQRYCSSCGALLTGEFCAACGQRRLAGRLTLGSLALDVVRRVYRFDQAFAVTLWRLLRAPGRLVADYLAGRRARYLDPIQYLISCVFMQFLVTLLTRWLAPSLNRVSALSWLWLGELNGVLAIKVLNIFWMGTLWRLMFRSRGYNLAEIYVFAMYAFGTTGLLWAALPLVDLAAPYPLSTNPVTVMAVMLGVEAAYLTYAVQRFSRLPLWECTVRVLAVLSVGYVLLIALVGAERLGHMLLPIRPPAT
jgi:Protein of unknown function (DUF3667)